MQFFPNSVFRNLALCIGLSVILLAGCGGDDEPTEKSKPTKSQYSQPSKSKKADSTVATKSTGKQTTKKPKVVAPTQPDPILPLRASLEDAANLLREGDIRAFLLHHVPVEELRELRERNAVDFVVKTLSANSEGQARLLQVYELACRTEMLPNTAMGLVELTVILPDVEPLGNGMPDLPDPRAEVVALPPGFSDDLVECLTLAADALEGGALPTFISKMLPPSDFRDYAAGSNGLELVQFLGRNPAMINAMETELRALASETPSLSDDGNVGTFERNGRTIRFQLVDGSWRFFDDSLPVRSATFQQSQQQPTDVRVTLRLERIGENWRAYQWPAELMGLLTPRDESM